MLGFGKKKAPPIRSLIGEGTVVRGNISFAEGMRIDGEVIGDVTAAQEGRSILVISDNARVHGRVAASHVIINGEVQGDLVCSELLEVQPKARISGGVRYEMLEMHPGAQVEGELRPLKSAEKPALKLAASNEV
ncbi:MAG: polymer-forming cytoskeletal protein [Rubrivivax sp.]|nr:polymer-forming cytoskeletal protein [Rubrivivax sp.]